MCLRWCRLQSACEQHAKAGICALLLSSLVKTSDAYYRTLRTNIVQPFSGLSAHHLSQTEVLSFVHSLSPLSLRDHGTDHLRNRKESWKRAATS